MPRETKKISWIYSKRFQTVFIMVIVLLGVGYYYFHFIVNANFKIIVPNKVYRSAQPSETQLKRWVKKYGIKTVINLRSKNPNISANDTFGAKESEIKSINFELSGNRLITRRELLDLITAIENAETPILLHCKSGIDRTGFASTIAAFAIGHVDFDTAKMQAYVPPGLWKRKDFSKTRGDYIHNYAHISDTLKLYEDYCSLNNIDKNDWSQFVQWAAELPSAEKMQIEYKPVYAYFPYHAGDKKFIPVFKLLRESYIQFSIEILIVILLVYNTILSLRYTWKK